MTDTTELFMEKKGIKRHEIIPVYSQDGSVLREIPVYKLLQDYESSVRTELGTVTRVLVFMSKTIKSIRELTPNRKTKKWIDNMLNKANAMYNDPTGN